MNINVLSRTWTCQQPKFVLTGGTAGGATAKYELYNGGVGFVNVYEILRRSDYFNCYAPMYDQFKIDMVRVKVTPSNYPSEEASNRYLSKSSSYTVVTAWDRTGFSLDQFKKLPADSSAAVSNLNPEHYYLLMPPEVACTTYSSAMTKNINTGSSFNIIRYLYPSTQQENGQYISTKSLKRGYSQHFSKTTGNNNTQMNGISCPYYDDVEVEAIVAPGGGDVTYVDNNNPCNPVESQAVPFKPTFLIGLLGYTGLTASDAAKEGANAGDVQGCIDQLTLNLEFDIGVTFRGLRKTQIV